VLSEIRDLKPGMLIRDTYRIVRKLGKGGMGAVYLAQQTLLNEPRALKFLSQELTEDGDFTNRFLQEVRTLRQVRNRNVVDCGDPERAEDGSLFFSMEYVDGPSLGGYLQTAPKPFDVETALGITWGIAKGLGAAHAKGLVHRDIKPDNVLMARDGDALIPKIADFGLVATKESSHMTRTGSMLLTMAFAAPEQWMGTRASDLDGRTDLYALGGVLFEMLTGRTPFEAENYHEWAQKHMSVPPPIPSSLRPELAKWKGLDALVLRLLAKDRKDRPQDVAELLTLLEAVVYEPGPMEMEAEAGTASVAAPATAPPAPVKVPAPVSGTYGNFDEPVMSNPTAQYEEVPRPRTPTARPPEQPAQAGSSAPESATTGRVYEVNTEGRSSRRISSQIQALKEKQEAKRSKGFPAWGWLVILLVLAGAGFAVQHFYVPRARFNTLQYQTDAITSVAFNSNGQTLASASRDNTIQLWSLVTMGRLLTLKDRVDSVTFSPDGHMMASADSDKDVRVWDVSTGQVLATLDGHTGEVNAVAFSPDGKTLASGGSDMTIRLWDVAADKTLAILLGSTGDINTLAFSPDGKTLASGGADNAIRLWDVGTGKVAKTLQGHSRAVNSAVYSPDGRTLASGGDDNTIKLWDAATGRLTATLQGHTGPVLSVAFSHDGHMLASGSADSTVRLWDLSGTPSAFTTLQGHTAAVNSVAFSRDGSTLASGSADDTVRLWDLSTVGR
jgi:WD40 repeat protein/serine/threonine protein kinase